MDQIESAVLRIYKQQPSLEKRFSTTKYLTQRHLELIPLQC